MIAWRKLTALFLVAAATAQAAPKEQPTPPPPPMPQTQNVTIFRGRAVEIPLRAIGRAPSQLKFLIRTPPKYGRLGEIRFTGRKTAVVTYYHDEKATAGYDSFAYAVQAVDTAVSAAGTVHIAISEEPPALSVVHTLDFGQLWVGESREEEITVLNTGGGSLAGRIIVSEPWRILGSAEYRLARREQKKVRVLFAPADAGEFAARLLFSHDPRSSVTLSGGAEAPLEFEPAEAVVLSLEAGKTTRAGGLTIRNRTPVERTVEISVPETIEAPEEISVPANGESSLEFRTKPGFLAALEDRVDLQSDLYQRSLPLRVPALPPVLRAEPADGLNFGTIPLKFPSRQTLTLHNDGGSPARVRIDAPPEVLLIPDPNAAVLAPGEKRSFEVELEVSGTGTFRKSIVIAPLGAPVVSLPVVARGIEGEPRPGPVLPGEAHPSVKRDLPSSLPPRTLVDEAPAETLSAIPPVTDFQTQVISPRALEIRWKKPAPNAVSTLIEYRSVQPGVNGPAKVAWHKWQGAAVREESGDVVALFGNLPLGHLWYIRFTSIDETGRRSRPSPTFRLATPPAPPVLWYWWVLGLVVVGGGVYGFVLIRRGREAEDRADAERLSRLGKF